MTDPRIDTSKDFDGIAWHSKYLGCILYASSMIREWQRNKEDSHTEHGNTWTGDEWAEEKARRIEYHLENILKWADNELAKYPPLIGGSLYGNAPNDDWNAVNNILEKP